MNNGDLTSLIYEFANPFSLLQVFPIGDGSTSSVKTFLSPGYRGTY